MVRGAKLARPYQESDLHRALGSGELIPQKERNSDAPKGAACS